jgi:hypothetical protein
MRETRREVLTMNWLDTLLDRGLEARREARPLAALPVAKPKPRQPKPEIKTVWVQTRPPRDGDAGGCKIGYYSVAGGVVAMRDEKGQPTGKTHRLGPDDNERTIAGRLTLQSWHKAAGESDFDRPLYYPPRGLA